MTRLRVGKKEAERDEIEREQTVEGNSCRGNLWGLSLISCNRRASGGLMVVEHHYGIYTV